MNEEIRVLWNCHMGEACSNTERPGVHEGDDGYDDARRCRGEYVEPVEPQNVRTIE